MQQLNWYCDYLIYIMLCVLWLGLGLLTLIFVVLHEQPMVSRLEDGPDNERSAAKHHAWAHAVETDLIVPG